jgi:hypothetical protein
MRGPKAHGIACAAPGRIDGKWNADAIERALAHIENNDVRRAYLRAEFWDERVAMAQWWADLIDELRGGAAQ